MQRTVKTFDKLFQFVEDNGGRNGATDSASDCCIIRGAVAGFESLTIIRSQKCLVDPGYIIDT